MAVTSLGFQWLKEHYYLDHHILTHCSYLGSRGSIEMTSKGNIEQIYGSGYATKNNTPLEHLEFGIKYDDLNLDFLQSVFRKMRKGEVEAFIRQSPSGKYHRKIGFLYELLTGTDLMTELQVNANYIDLLDEEKYITGTMVKNSKWRINNNLLGDHQFCPIVRRTHRLSGLLEINIEDSIGKIRREYPEDIFSRVIRYLYNKETKSSYEIEKEQPSPDRMDKFIALLMKAGSEDPATMLSKQELIALQNAIVDPRYAAKDFRDFQNYVGELLPNYQELIHYICPPPTLVNSLMDGLQECWFKANTVPASLKAAIISFGFVFIHPFEDGNGRLHRFLIHDILVQGGMVPKGQIVPVSAHMLSNLKDYDYVLEKYSDPLMLRAKYEKNQVGEISISNLENVEGYYRYPDLTDQCVYLLETIHATIKEDMPAEFAFLQRYDEAKKALQNIVDMPDKDINLMLIFLHQNKGEFPKRRRLQFSKLTDEEIFQMAKVYKEIYELP
ncbi:Fic family protein [Pseudobacter ginsenosidimutans]|uniref:Fic/DOC family protein n=1 Tax=Pseudobacter ginsenosidimutans TaxID=661488 RepID=A0A4Q7N5H5_9BACT|nr:Fic family protein [Pseudobacter ginsenosidimutans]QEC44812.1 Fic family protein [Pseudobacter ginsenosidimutans]RZS76302.1 Fic/DOC family protein [Pseudobacter ginsenosidimutans]